MVGEEKESEEDSRTIFKKKKEDGRTRTFLEENTG